MVCMMCELYLGKAVRDLIVHFVSHHIKGLMIAGCPSINDAPFDLLVRKVIPDLSRVKACVPFASSE